MIGTSMFPRNVKGAALNSDWVHRGSQTISRFINFYPERVAAAGFLALGYVPPNPEKTDIQTVLDATKKIFGYELFGYFLFFDEEGNEDIVKSHVSLPLCSPIVLFILLTTGAVGLFPQPHMAQGFRIVEDRSGPVGNNQGVASS